MKTVSIEDIYRETEKAYYIRLEGQEYCFLKEEVELNGTTARIPEPGHRKDENTEFDTKIIPAKMIRQKNEERYRLEDLSRFWGVSVTKVRKIFLERGLSIKRANAKEVV